MTYELPESRWGAATGPEAGFTTPSHDPKPGEARHYTHAPSRPVHRGAARSRTDTQQRHAEPGRASGAFEAWARGLVARAPQDPQDHAGTGGDARGLTEEIGAPAGTQGTHDGRTAGDEKVAAETVRTKVIEVEAVTADDLLDDLYVDQATWSPSADERAGNDQGPGHGDHAARRTRGHGDQDHGEGGEAGSTGGQASRQGSGAETGTAAEPRAEAHHGQEGPRPGAPTHPTTTPRGHNAARGGEGDAPHEPYDPCEGLWADDGDYEGGPISGDPSAGDPSAGDPSAGDPGTGGPSMGGPAGAGSLTGATATATPAPGDTRPQGPRAGEMGEEAPAPNPTTTADPEEDGPGHDCAALYEELYAGPDDYEGKPLDPDTHGGVRGTTGTATHAQGAPEDQGPRGREMGEEAAARSAPDQDPGDTSSLLLYGVWGGGGVDGPENRPVDPREGRSHPVEAAPVEGPAQETSVPPETAQGTRVPDQAAQGTTVPAVRRRGRGFDPTPLEAATVELSTRAVLHAELGGDPVLVRWAAFCLLYGWRDEGGLRVLPYEALNWVWGEPVGRTQDVVGYVEARLPGVAVVDHVTNRRCRLVERDGLSAQLHRAVEADRKKAKSAFAERVCLLTGHRWVPRHGHEARNATLARVRTHYDEAPTPVARYVLERMNERSSRVQAKVLDRVGEARDLVRRMRIRVKTRRRKGEPLSAWRGRARKQRDELRRYYHAVVDAVEDQHQQFYVPSHRGRTDRCFAYNAGVLLLPKRVRAVLLQDYHEIDLQSAHLRIAASLWGATGLLEALDTPGFSVWAHVAGEMGVPLTDTVKAALKRALYSTVYGMRASAVKAGVTKAIGSPKGHGVEKGDSYGKRFARVGIVRELFEARAVALERIGAAGYAEAPDGYRFDVTSDASPESCLASVAQHIEQALMCVVLEYEEAEEQASKPHFRVAFWVHDGCYVAIARRAELHVRRLQERLAARAAELGVTAVFEHTPPTP